MKTTILLFLILFSNSFSFSQNTPHYIPVDNLVAWWPFSGDVNDQSGNGYNGVLNGPILIEDRFGNTDNAYSFDGVDDFIEIFETGDHKLDVDGDFSISFWFQTTDNGNSYKTFFSKRAMSGLTFEEGYTIFLNNNRVNYHLEQTNGGYTIIEANTLQVNNWRHVVILRDSESNMISVYYDGVLNAYVSDYLNNSIFSMENLLIGKTKNYDTPSVNYGFEGAMDDIAIWNRVLTENEISNLYLGCSSVSPIVDLEIAYNVGSNASLVVQGNSNASYFWESNPNDFGWLNVPNSNKYGGNGTNTLSISDLQLSNHNQPFRVIVSDEYCTDTSEVVFVNIGDTCMLTVYDTISVTDTLIIDINLADVANQDNFNTIKVYPNPSSSIVNIDNGNYILMDGYHISVKTLLGQEVYNEPIESQLMQISISDIGSTGSYFLQIIDSNSSIVESKTLIFN